MILVLIGKGLVFGGLAFKNRGQLGSRNRYNRFHQPTFAAVPPLFTGEKHHEQKKQVFLSTSTCFGQISVNPYPAWRAFWWSIPLRNHHLVWPRRFGRYNLSKLWCNKNAKNPNLNQWEFQWFPPNATGFGEGLRPRSFKRLAPWKVIFRKKEAVS